VPVAYEPSTTPPAASPTPPLRAPQPDRAPRDHLRVRPSVPAARHRQRSASSTRDGRRRPPAVPAVGAVASPPWARSPYPVSCGGRRR